MALFKSGNPALQRESFEGFEKKGTQGVMTLQGTVDKTAILLILVIASALYTWNLYLSTGDFESVALYLWLGSIGGLAVAFGIAFNKDWSPVLAPLYAILEGLCLGGLSAIMNEKFPGIVVQSLLLTFGIAFSLLIIYRLRIIQPTENFKLMVASATAGIAIYYLISFALLFFGIEAPLINENSTSGIFFSLFVVFIASMNLVVDFDFIEQGANNGVPKYMEWYSAFGLMVTLIWLYIEILRLLAKSRSRK